MNSVVIIGRLTKAPEVRYTAATQMAVATFTVAVDRPVRAGMEKQTDFPRVTVFGKQAENCERYLDKGRLVGIQGRLQTGSYQNRDGSTVYTTDVVADRVEFLEWGNNNQNSQANYQQPAQPMAAPQQQAFNQAQMQGFSAEVQPEPLQAEMPDSFEQIQEDVPF